jgi:GLPGLI family protein
MNQRQRLIVLLAGIVLGGTVLIQDLNAQDFQGIATYRSDRDMSNFAFNGDNMSPDMVENLKAQLKKQFQKDYELRFNLTESTWQEAESLDAGAATASAGGMTLSISMGGGLTYKNTSTKSYLQQTESFSKLFLIKDELEDREWIMTGATKKIGDYQAYEATYDNIRERKTFALSDEDKKMETVTDTTSITVWYTPEIPVPHGPEDYWGLPGLILELNDGNVTYLCTKVVLNPEKEIAIEIPSKGKEVTEEEFRVLSEEMAEKMMKKYSGGEDGENVMTIKIGQ